MDTYGNPEFEELLKEKENEACFDCSKNKLITNIFLNSS